MSRIWLFGAVAFVIALVVAGLIVALVVNSEVDLLPADSPEGVVQRYLLALEDEEYEEAYGYLSSEQQARCSLAEFAARAPAMRAGGSRMILEDAQTFDDTAIVRAEVTELDDDVPFGPSEHSYDRTYRLSRDAGQWRLAEPEWWCPPGGY